MKNGLVLEGGAMRGMFTAGVIDVLMENGIEFDGAVGVSAGAAFGCNIKSGQRGRAIRYTLRFADNKSFCSGKSLLTTGDLFGGEFCYHTIPEKLDIFDKKAFEESPMEFFVVCTDLATGKPFYHKMRRADYNDLEWLRASASMPLVSNYVELDGKRFLDGGISDSIPLSFMEKSGYDRNVVILTQPRNYIKEKTKSLSLVKMKYRKYPNFVKAVADRHKMYNNELKYVRASEKSGKALVIAPDIQLPIGHIEHDIDVIQRVYRIGRRIANEKLESIIDFLSK